MIDNNLQKNLSWEEVEKFLKEMIKFHGLNSHTEKGFSCYIPDIDNREEGFLIWNCSSSYKRIETQIQKFHAAARIAKMEKLGVDPIKYKERMINLVKCYIKQFQAMDNVYSISEKSVNLFDDYQSNNYAVIYLPDPIDIFYKRTINKYKNIKSFNLMTLKLIEEFTINNDIVKFFKNIKYFVLENADNLLWDKYNF